MPIMTMHDVRKDKTYSAEKGLTLEELAKEAGVDYPKEPKFESTEAIKKNEEDAPKKRGRKKKEEVLDYDDDLDA